LLRDFGWKTIIDLGDITAARVGYQEEVSRINRLLEEHTRARAEFEKLLVSTMVITASRSASRISSSVRTTVFAICSAE
jgi:hypothetical protein